MAAQPPKNAYAAIFGASSRITRRIEIYEQDGKTKFLPRSLVLPDFDDPMEHAQYLIQLYKSATFYPIDGSVAVSGSSTSNRRTLETTIENLDGYLDPYPGGFWYDKIIKVFRGVEYDVPQPKIVIIQDASNTASAFKTMLTTFGYTDVSVKTNLRTLAQLRAYDVIVALGGNTNIDSVNVTPLLVSLYAEGKGIWTSGDNNTGTHVPLITATQTKGTASPAYRIEPTDANHFVAKGWVAEDESSGTGTLPTAIRAGAVAIAKMTFNSTLSYTGIAEENTLGGRWFHYHDSVFNPEATVLAKRAMDWLDDTRDRTTAWEVQIGEFMIDEISRAHEPSTIKIKGRDYAKKCMLSKFGKATTFKQGQSLEVVVRALASNAGITKMKVATSGHTLGRDFAFEADVARWDAMTQLATAFSQDLYFDHEGYLVMEPFADPAGKTTTFTFKTGTGGGNLVSFEKTSNDTRIYNHIIVTGQAANSTPIFAEAKNEVAGSPTSIAEIGDRVYRYNSSLITTYEQALSTAKRFLALHALEEFSLSLSSIVVPWLEAADVVDFIDPDPAPGDPTRFLLTEFSIPLDLGPMSATARRVRQVLS